MQYEKPVVVAQNEVTEGVYAHSGTLYTTCSSQYMNGIYQAPVGGRIPSGTETTGRKMGCQTCPGDRNWACRCEEGSYELLMPQWEKDGHTPDETFLYTE